MTTDFSDYPPDNAPRDPDAPQEIAERPWIHLKNTHDVEAWINNYDWDLRRHVAQGSTGSAAGVGICFRLAHGGEIILHTTPDGDVLLDVLPDTAWAHPVI